MNRFLVPIFAVIAIAAGAFAWLQFDNAARLQRQLATEREAAAQNGSQAEVERLKATATAAQENVARLTAERDAALARAKSLRPGPPLPPGAPPPGGEKGGGDGMMASIAKMYSTEDGRKMMRSQMNVGLKMQYGGLAKELKLDPNMADQVFALLGDRQAALTEATFAAMKGGALDEAAGKELAAKSEAVQKDYTEKLKAVLGDEGVNQLKDYERTLGDRMMLSMHEQQFSTAGAPLEQAQRDSLLQIMKDERSKTPASPFDASNSGDAGKTMMALKDDATIEAWLKQEEDYQRRVLQAAPKTLNPDQVSALQESFKQQTEMQRFGIKMGKEMFKGSPSVTPPSTAK
jgi:hypothetical protein